MRPPKIGLQNSDLFCKSSGETVVLENMRPQASCTPVISNFMSHTGKAHDIGAMYNGKEVQDCQFVEIPLETKATKNVRNVSNNNGELTNIEEGQTTDTNTPKRVMLFDYIFNQGTSRVFYCEGRARDLLDEAGYFGSC